MHELLHQACGAEYVQEASILLFKTVYAVNKPVSAKPPEQPWGKFITHNCVTFLEASVWHEQTGDDTGHMVSALNF